MNFKKTLQVTGILLPVFAFCLHSPTVRAEEFNSVQRHPEMMRALKALQNAETALETAQKGDKGGYRVKALQDTKQALASTQAAIDYDNSHLSGKEIKHQENK